MEGKKIGETVMRVAGIPAAIRLTPDRTKLSASGEYLFYLLFMPGEGGLLY